MAKTKAQARTIALTGTRSFLGERLLTYLDRKKEVEKVICLDTRPPRVSSPKISYVPCDLTLPGVEAEVAQTLKAEQVGTLVHLAFLSNPTHQSAHAHELEAIGTMYLLAAAGAARVRKIVMRSTTMVYGAHPDNPNFLTEDHPLRGMPDSRFVNDKVEAERLLKRHRRAYPGTVCTSLRYATILGPRIHTYMTRFFSRPVVPCVMGYDPLMQFLHEDDAARALALAVEGDFDGAFHIVPDGVIPLSTALKILGCLPLPIPAPLLYSLTQTLWSLQAIEVPARWLNYLRYLWVADGARAREVMGFVPRYRTLDTIESFARRRREGEPQTEQSA